MLAVSFLALSAASTASSSAQQLLTSILNQFDTNHDGVVDSSDAAGLSGLQGQLLQAAISTADRNGDGQVDASDFLPLVNSLDTNHDGTVNLNDLPASLRSQLSRFDTNNDGRIDDADLPAILSGLSQSGTGSVDLSTLSPALRAALASLDANNDGHLSLSDLSPGSAGAELLSHIQDGTIRMDDLPSSVRTQLQAALSSSLRTQSQPIVTALNRTPQGQQLITSLDTNSDGQLDPQELSAWLATEVCTFASTRSAADVPCSILCSSSHRMGIARDALPADLQPVRHQW